jgi:hypothetical protein
MAGCNEVKRNKQGKQIKAHDLTKVNNLIGDHKHMCGKSNRNSSTAIREVTRVEKYF